ncbi:hypothetical protein [Pseudoblastomonas halimionae]|uniref:Helix-turn-helix domain-containing protein n=1 Tax=Alteriqipengyuania halimionae TaxID=1926630 RepID=A0A6I4U3T3_9SPHN|nr:hypothetical protein [Alteriqipengyuania halimionae]MXP10759.1 hypothetical protein [Alteriqipengyuania halimionae]
MLPNGRNNTSRFARLDHRILHSNAYRALSPNDRSLLVELISLYNGENNGSIYLSVRDAAHRMGVADLAAASRSFDTLQALGFIVLTLKHEFRSGSSGQSRARSWRLTWLPGPGRKAPSWEFLEKEPEPQSSARKRMERGLRVLKSYKRGRERGRFPALDSDTLEQFRPIGRARAVLDSDTAKVENGGNQPIGSVRETATHIATPWGECASGYPFGWWRPDWSDSISALTFFAHVGAVAESANQEKGVA